MYRALQRSLVRHGPNAGGAGHVWPKFPAPSMRNWPTAHCRFFVSISAARVTGQLFSQGQWLFWPHSPSKQTMFECLMAVGNQTGVCMLKSCTEQFGQQ